MVRRLLTAALLCVTLVRSGPASAAPDISFTSTPNVDSALFGLHLNRPSTDTSNPHGISYDINHNPIWDAGLDFDVAHFPNPDLVLAFSHHLTGTTGDVLRLRADTGQMVLGPGIGHPSDGGAEFQVYAGTSTAPLPGLSAGVFGNQPGLLLSQSATGTNRTKIQFNGTIGSTMNTPIWQLGVDSAQNGGTDFWFFNDQTSTFPFKFSTVSAADAIGFFGATPVNKPIVSGSRGGNAALGSLISALASLGLITDNTTP